MNNLPEILKFKDTLLGIMYYYFFLRCTYIYLSLSRIISVLTSAGHRLTVLSKPAAGVITSTITPLNKVLPSQATSSASTITSQGSRPVMRVPPLHVTSAGMGNQQPVSRLQPTLVATTSVQHATVLRPAPPLATTTVLNARLLAMAENMKKSKEQPQQPQSIFHLVCCSPFLYY
jgi:hypothetical protein